MEDFIILIKEKIIEQEGFRDKVYTDTEGVLTFGYGHNIENNPIPPRILKTIINVGAKEGAKELLEYDIQSVYFELMVLLPWWERQPQDVKYVLFDLAFNMGVSKLKTFRKTLKFIKKGKYKKASKELLNSKYAMQVPNRAKNNATILLNA
jgi:lysozyme